MFSVGDIIILVIIGIIFVAIGIYACIDQFTENKTKALVVLIECVVLSLCIFGCAAYNTQTESGKRHIKSANSEYQGGLDRTVTVYDINGEEVAKYHGRFDIEETSQEGVVKIKFDCDGKRHIIYAQTGTVLIDED